MLEFEFDFGKVTIGNNAAENWEIMLLGQTAAGLTNNKINPLGTGLFLRLMVNF